VTQIAYESDHATLWLGDSADVIAELPRKSVDLIATDPPYGVKWQSGRRKASPRFARIIGDDGSLDVPGVLGAATDALRDCRHVYVFGYAPGEVAVPLRLGGPRDRRRIPVVGDADAWLVLARRRRGATRLRRR
jgi:hypothetical protein